MICQGYVVKITPRFIRLETSPKGGCKSCAEAGNCMLYQKNLFIDARPNASVSLGDYVEFEMPERSSIIAIILVFLFPLTGLFGGYFLGKYFFYTDIAGAISSFAGLIIAFGILRLFEKYVLKVERFRPYITHIISKKDK